MLGIYNNYNSAHFRLTLVHSSQNSRMLIPKPLRHSERQLGLGLCLYGIKMVTFQQHIMTLGHIEWPSLSVSKTSHLTKPDHCSPLSQIITSNSVADIVKWKISEQRGKNIENYKKHNPKRLNIKYYNILLNNIKITICCELSIRQLIQGTDL